MATKSSIDTCRQKVIQELGMDLHQNDSKTAGSIKEAKAICTCGIQEAKTICSVTIRDGETVCSAAIREAETQGAFQAESLYR